MSEFQMPSITWVLVINLIMNIYVFMLYHNLDGLSFNEYLNFSFQKHINLFESVLSVVALIFIEKQSDSYFKNLMKFIALGSIFTLLFCDAVSDISTAIQLIHTKVSNPSQHIWFQVAAFVLFVDFVFKISAIMIMRSFLIDMLPGVNPFAGDNSSEQGILLDDEISSLPPYEECIEMNDSSMPPPYSEICKNETV